MDRNCWLMSMLKYLKILNYQTSQKIKFLGQCDFFSSSYEPYSWYLSTVSTEKSVRSVI
jgi:hypothetical protein